MIDDGNVASIMQRVENREWVEFPLQRVREVFAKIVILPVTESVTRSAIKVLYNSPFHYLVCPNTANSFAVTLSVMDFLKRRGETMETMDVEALYAAPREELKEAFERVVKEGEECCVVCLNGAHPGKFPYFVAEALNAPAGNIMPKDIQE